MAVNHAKPGMWVIWRLYHRGGWESFPVNHDAGDVTRGRGQAMRAAACGAVPAVAQEGTEPTNLRDHSKQILCPHGLKSTWFCPERMTREPSYAEIQLGGSAWQVEPWPL